MRGTLGVEFWPRGSAGNLDGGLAREEDESLHETELTCAISSLFIVPFFFLLIGELGAG